MISFQTEFMRGMVILVMEKLAHDLPHLVHDDMLFSHTVDEVLLFDRELHSTHGYPPTLPGCLDLLTTHDALTKWLEVEKKCKRKILEHNRFCEISFRMVM